MAGIIGAMLAGGAEGAGIGLASQGKAWTEKQHQDALNEAQALRAQSLAELQGRIQTGIKRDVEQPFQKEQNEAQRKSAEGIHSEDRASREREGAADRQLRGRQLDQQARQIEAGIKQIDVAVQKGQLEVDAANRLKGLHEKYLAAISAGDAKAADSIADQIYTLAGKDKFTPLMGKDDMGNPVFMGGFNTRTGKRDTGQSASGVDWSQFITPANPQNRAPAAPSAPAGPATPGTAITPRGVVNRLMAPVQKPPLEDDEEQTLN